MVINLDGESQNADWTKVTPDLPTTREGLLRFLDGQHMTVDQFRRLPVYRWNREHFDRLLAPPDNPPDVDRAKEPPENPRDVDRAKEPPALRRPAHLGAYVDYETLIEWQVRILTGRPKPDDLGTTLSQRYDEFAQELADAPRGAIIDIPND